MAACSADFWDARYQTDQYVYGRHANTFLTTQRHRLDAGWRALAVGDGEGRNGVWLARQGLRVTSVDVSPVAVQKALKLALDRAVTLQAVCADVTTWDWPRDVYDVAVSVFLHLPPDQRPAVHAGLVRAVRPGGLVLLEAFTPRQRDYPSGGPPDAALLYDTETLRADFAGAEILELTEQETTLDEGPGHRGAGHTVRLVARRPDERR